MKSEVFITEVKTNIAEIVTADIMASKNNLTNQREGSNARLHFYKQPAQIFKPTYFQ